MCKFIIWNTPRTLICHGPNQELTVKFFNRILYLKSIIECWDPRKEDKEFKTNKQKTTKLFCKIGNFRMEKKTFFNGLKVKIRFKSKGNLKWQAISLCYRIVNPASWLAAFKNNNTYSFELCQDINCVLDGVCRDDIWIISM